MNKYEIRIFAEGKKLYFENEDMDIKVVIMKNLTMRYLNFKFIKNNKVSKYKLPAGLELMY